MCLGRHLLNAIFHASLDFASFDIAVNVNFLSSKANDEDGDIELREDSGAVNVHSSDIQDLAVWS